MSSNSYRPSITRGVALIIRREFGHYFKTWSGYIIAALMLLFAGLLFQFKAVGSVAQPSSQVLAQFYFWISGLVAAAGLFFSMRLVAEERQNGTLPILTTSPLSEGQIILAKFLSAFFMLGVLILLTLYMPLLIFVHGDISLGHIAAGYVGLLLIGSSAVAIGLFGSAIAPSQLIAVVISGAITGVLTVIWYASSMVEGSLGDFVSHLALFDRHYRPFIDGTISLYSIIFYPSLNFFFLTLARNALEARRWKP